MARPLIFPNIFYFRHMIFCIEKQLFCKGTFVTVENDLFSEISSSVPFTPRSLASGDSSRKFFLLFLSQGNTIPENTKVYCLKFYSENWLLKVVVCFCYSRKRSFLGYVFFSTFRSQRSSLC